MSKLTIFEHFLSVWNRKPKLKWFFKPNVSIEFAPRSSDAVHASSGERLRSKSRDDRKDSRNLDLRKEHDEMRARNQVGK